MTESIGTEDRGHRKILILLFLFMIACMILFFAWSYNIVESGLKCNWKKNDRSSYYSGKTVDSNTTAKQVFLEFNDIEENTSLEIEKLGPSYWEIKVKNRTDVEEKYGVNSMGKIYGYKKNCIEGNQSIVGKITDFIDRAAEKA